MKPNSNPSAGMFVRLVTVEREMKLEEYLALNGKFPICGTSVSEQIWEAATVAARDECAAIVLKNAHMFYTSQACQGLADEVRANEKLRWRAL